MKGVPIVDPFSKFQYATSPVVTSPACAEVITEGVAVEKRAVVARRLIVAMRLPRTRFNMDAF